MWFLFQYVLNFTASSISEYSDYRFLKSFPKVIYLFKVQIEFYNNEVTDVCIWGNCCNKTVTCQCSKIVTIDTLPVFIKAAVFHHVGPPWMIETKKKNYWWRQHQWNYILCSYNKYQKVGCDLFPYLCTCNQICSTWQKYFCFSILASIMYYAR